MNIRFHSCFSLFVFVLAATGCSRRPAAAFDPPAPAVSSNGGAPVVRLDPSAEMNVRIETVSARPVARTLRATGTVHFDESRIARIVAPVAGQVADLHVNVGDHVRRGESLFLINSREAASAIEDHLDAHRDLDLAEKTLAMTQDLYEHQAASRIALEQAKSDAGKARARVERTEASLRAIGLHLGDDGDYLEPRVPATSPVEGSVVERHVSDGQYVQPDPNPLLVVADLSTVWVEADVFERDLHLVHTGDSAEVMTAAYPEARFTARVSRISDVVDPATRTVKVRFRVTNPGLRLKPEMFADVTLSVSDTEQAITVPAAAVLTEGSSAYVYVALDPHTFTRRPVELATPTATEFRRVAKGLKPGDAVVTRGALLLRGLEGRTAS